jgi:hypothetical protein
MFRKSFVSARPGGQKEQIAPFERAIWLKNAGVVSPLEWIAGGLSELAVTSHKVVRSKERSVQDPAVMLWVGKPTERRRGMGLHQDA